MLILKHLKNPPTCFDHYSDRLQGARRFLVNLLKPKDIYIYIYIYIYMSYRSADLQTLLF